MTSTEFIKLLSIWSDIMAEKKDYLIELDSVVGDGDLGLTMSDGFKAAYEAVKDKSDKDIGTVSYFGGKAMASAVPSTMGTLMASGFMSAGKLLKGKNDIDLSGLHDFFKGYFDGVANRGGAKVGDKTFLDGMDAVVNSLKDSVDNGEDIKAASLKAYEQSEKAFKNTATVLAVHGRAATRGEDSRSLLDPGAAVAMLMAQGLKQFAQ